MRVVSQAINFDLETRVYDVVIENINNEDVFDKLEVRFIEAGFLTDSFEEGELWVAMCKDDYVYTKSEFIKEVRRIAKGK